MLQPHLDFSNMEEYTYLLPALFSCEQRVLDEDETLSGETGQYLLLYLLKGSGSCEFGGANILHTEPVTLSPNKLLLLPPHMLYSLHAEAPDAELLRIAFQFVGGRDEIPKFLAATPPQACAPMLYLPLLSGIVRYSDEAYLLAKIAKEVHNKNKGYRHIVQAGLTELVVLLFRDNVQQLESVTCNVCAITFSSTFCFDTPLPKDTRMWISAVEFWTENPEASPNAQIITEMVPEHPFQESPKNRLLSFETDRDQPYRGHPTGRVIACETTQYKFWMFPEEGRGPIDFRPLMDDCYIRLYVRGNYTGPMALSIYNRENYRCINHILDVRGTGEWQRFLLPFLGPTASHSANEYVTAAIRFIHSHYTQKLPVAEIARHVHLHPSYLSALFKKQTGNSVGDYIIFYRLMMAKNMLVNTQLNVESIALTNGFYDIQHFSRVFKARVGLSPLAFRKRNQKQPSRDEERLPGPDIHRPL